MDPPMEALTEKEVRGLATTPATSIINPGQKSYVQRSCYRPWGLFPGGGRGRAPLPAHLRLQSKQKSCNGDSCSGEAMGRYENAGQVLQDAGGSRERRDTLMESSS